MDEFVQNLFQGIDIPEGLVDVENVIESPYRCSPLIASQGVSQHDSEASQSHVFEVPLVENDPIASQSVESLPIMSRPTSQVDDVTNKRPISSVITPFVPPDQSKQEASWVSDPYKKPRQDPQLKKENVIVCSQPSAPKELCDGKKTVSERYPLQGPAGLNTFTLLNNVIMKGSQESSDGINKGENSWMKAMRMLDSNDLGYDFKKNPDFPEDFSISEYVTQKFNIKWIISGARIHKFGFKMEWLVVLIVSQSTMGLHVMCVLMDRSGQMLGYLNEELRSKFKHIGPGCTLILKNVFVYNPVGCMPYLVIRPSGIIKVVRN